MDDIAILMRMIERLIVVIMGGVCIVLGYRLFFFLPLNEQNGQFELPGVKVVLSKVGPGIFFLVFGSLLLLHNLNKNVTVGGSSVREGSSGSPTAIAGMQSDNSASQGFSGAINEPRFDAVHGSPEPLLADTPMPIYSPSTLEASYNHIAALNCLARESQPLSSAQAVALHRAKVAILAPHWDDSRWGSLVDFDDQPTGHQQLGAIYAEVSTSCATN